MLILGRKGRVVLTLAGFMCAAGLYIADVATDDTSLAPLVALPVLAITFAAGLAAGIIFSLIAGFAFGTVGHTPASVLPNAVVLAASFVVVAGLFTAARSWYARSVAFQAELGEVKAFHDMLFVDEQRLGSRWRAHVIHVPLRETGGDFYELRSTNGEGAEVFIADVAGKGVRASMLLSALKTLWGASGSDDPAEKLTFLNQQLHAVCGSDMFCTAFYARLNADGAVQYANAGHERPIVSRNGGVGEELAGGGIVLGIIDQPGYAGAIMQLSPGDALLLFTDGLSEIFDSGQLEVADFFLNFEDMRWKIPTLQRRDDVLAILLEYVPEMSAIDTVSG